MPRAEALTSSERPWIETRGSHLSYGVQRGRLGQGKGPPASRSSQAAMGQDVASCPGLVFSEEKGLQGLTLLTLSGCGTTGKTLKHSTCLPHPRMGLQLTTSQG